MTRNKTWILAGTAVTSLVMVSGAFAQSTATQDVEAVTEVIVTGSRAVGPTKRERGPKAKTTIGQDYLSKQPSGQTFADALNVVPGYNFSNNDAYGSSGGAITMRGLDSARVSVTLDGVQLNDSGNYAVYTNQMIEPELICTASVQTGATDVDSITASATGGTVNVASCLPEEELGGVVKLTVGESDHKGAFLRFDTGRIGPWGTRAYIAYSGSHTDTWTREPIDDLRIQKNQWNAFINQDIGDRGSFINAAIHWNENRNHFIAGQTKASIAQNGYGVNTNNYSNVNPSDTGNIRIQSKWVLTDKLTLTVDPTFQYTLALGGSTGNLSEDSAQLRGAAYSTVPYVDLNGDGNGTYIDSNGNVQSDTVSLYRPNITNTYRYALQSGLIYRFTESHLVRFNVALDRANHRQTGEVTLRDANGAPFDLWAGKKEAGLRVKTADGNYIRRRDRQSYADVDVYSLEYRGRFIEDKLGVSLGVRHQKLERELNQYCYSPVTGGAANNPYCSTQNIVTSTPTSDPAINVVTLEGSGTTRYFTPYQRTVSFSKTLPNVGLTWNFDHGGQIFGTYAESMSSPRTDIYYDVVLSGNDMRVKIPTPETSETFELGYRYSAPNFNATAVAFFAQDENRIVTAYDEETQTSTDTNVGGVDRKGFEASANYSPVQPIVLSAGLTWTDTEVKDDLPLGTTSTGAARFLPTTGKQLTGIPEWMFNFGLDYNITDRLNLNLNAKYVGDRYYTFVNDDIAPSYTVWNASLRYDLPWLKEGTYLQLNAVNLFDEKYLHGTNFQNNANELFDNTGTKVNPSNAVSYQLGAPRTVSLTLRTQF